MTDRPMSPLVLTAPRTIPWAGEAPADVTLGRVYVGPDPGGAGMQIAVATMATTPSRSVLKQLWDLRVGNRGIDAAVAVVHGDRVSVFGPDPDAQQIELPVGQAQRRLQAVLDEPDPLSAYDRFGDLRREIASTGTARGFINSGLFANHHLDRNVPTRADWHSAASRGTGLLHLRGQALIKELGFTVRQQGSALLLDGPTGSPRAIAVLLDGADTFDGTSAKHQLSPVAFGLREANEQHVDWLIALKDGRIRLYPGGTRAGVGQKGHTETFFELDLTAVDDEHAALLPLIFSAAALEPDGSTAQILDGSKRYATDLGTRLRSRIYERVVPPLATAVGERLPEMGVAIDEEGLRTAYRVTLRILFRLLFQAYAEDSGLLPSGRNEWFDDNSLKTAATRLRDADPAMFGQSSTLWSDLEQIWDAIDVGDAQMMIPAYNGGLFNRTTEEGALIARLRLPNSVMGPALRALLIDENDEGEGPVDFRSLKVREFGTIYEGLLESSLSYAESDLTLDTAGAWLPAREGDEVVAPQGSIYFHNSSGERKATGSYFTPEIVVEHLVERSIDPVLGKHLERVAELIAEGKDVEAGRAFFDFRVADLAMGSGHFLIAAIDRMERIYRDFLTRHPVPRVNQELARVRETAITALGRDKAMYDEVKNVDLLRRQIARRCIYGVDVNPLALELSRLALWIHTFVPGLPMSSFDHNLVCANSLTGIGTVDEALDALEPKRAGTGQVSLLHNVIVDRLDAAAELFLDAANADEADKGGVEAGARQRAEAREKLEPIRRVFDLAVAIRVGKSSAPIAVDAEGLDETASAPAVRDTVAPLNPAHLPYLFPEVFSRTRPGFDVLLGNPPWEELHVNIDKFWVRYFPGHMARTGSEKEELRTAYERERPDLVDVRDALRTDVDALSHGVKTRFRVTDMYQAFAYLYLLVTRDGGRFAAVLPRGVVSGASMKRWRELVAATSSLTDVFHCVNANEWMFEGVTSRTQIALVVVASGTTGLPVRVLGRAGGARAFIELSNGRPRTLTLEQLRAISDGIAVPSAPTLQLLDAFLRMAEAPRIGSRRPDGVFTVGLDGTASAFRALGRASEGVGAAVVQGGDVQLWARPDSPVRVWAESPDVPQILFRQTARADDSRSFICSLSEGGVLVKETAYWVRVDAEAPDLVWFALGCLSSRIFDWYARCLIDRRVLPSLFRAFPLPVFRPEFEPSRRIAELARHLLQVGPPAPETLLAELDALVASAFCLSPDEIASMLRTFHATWHPTTYLAAVLEHFRAWEGRA